MSLWDLSRSLAVVANVALAGACTGSAWAPARESASRIAIEVLEPAISSVPIDADFVPAARRGSPIELVATRGEYEPASFVVRSAIALDDVEIVATPLTLGSHAIPASDVDVRIVKLWYRDPAAWRSYRRTQPETPDQKLFPTLLLKDEAIVAPGPSGNVLRVRDQRGSWQAIEPRAEDAEFARAAVGFADAAELRPVRLDPDRSKQVWVTVHIPRSTAPGTYRGQLRIVRHGTTLATLDLSLRVLPFDLVAPSTIYSIYYRAVLSPTPTPPSSEHRTEAQMRADLRDMLAHGIANPTVYQSPADVEAFRKVLRLRAELGLSTQPLYLLGLSTWSDDPKIGAKAREVVAIAKEFGIPAVYIYGRDEASGDRLTQQRGAWTEIHDAGARVFVAGATGIHEAMGDLLDLVIFQLAPQPAEAAKWHASGRQIFVYDNPQAGVLDPYVWRRNYGVVIWAARYDGAMPYAFQHCFNDCFDDIDSTPYRDLMMTYPTATGPIDTLAWEGFREGVDDVRYIETLEAAIATASHDADGRAGEVANAATQYLAQLREDINADSTAPRDVAAIRSQVIRYLLELQPRSR